MKSVHKEAVEPLAAAAIPEQQAETVLAEFSAMPGGTLKIESIQGPSTVSIVNWRLNQQDKNVIQGKKELGLFEK